MGAVVEDKPDSAALCRNYGVLLGTTERSDTRGDFDTEKLERQRAARKLEEKREEAWRAYDEASRDIDRQKDELLDEIGRRLEQSVEQTPLFTMRWRLP